MKAIAKVKLTYDTAEFASTAEIVAHIQSELKDHYFLGEVAPEIENITLESSDGSQQEVFTNNKIDEAL